MSARGARKYSRNRSGVRIVTRVRCAAPVGAGKGDKPLNLFPEPSLSDLMEEAGEIIAKAKERFRPVATFALFSGGDDSTAMLHLVRPYVDAVVHINTGIGIPETTQFARETCAAWGKPLIEMRTDPSEYRLIVFGDSSHPGLGHGFPGGMMHKVCYIRLKERRLREIQRDYSKKGERLLLLSGVRTNESKRRKINVANVKIAEPNKSLTRCAWANPIVGFTSANLMDYRENHGIPQSPVAALIHKSGECLCGAFAKKGELEEIEFWFPETGRYIRSLEVLAEKAGKPYCRWGWGFEKLKGVPAPGPLCQGCTLFDNLSEKGEPDAVAE